MLTNLFTAYAAQTEQTGPATYDGPHFFPPGASSIAWDIDRVYLFIFWVSVVSFVILIGITAYFVWKYRAREGHKEEWTSPHNNLLEATWTIIPTIIVAVMFWVGMEGMLDLRQPPGDAYPIQVTAQKWSWKFSYPNGAEDVNLHVPIGRPVKLTMTSTDVLHSLFIPAFRVKQDIVPGRYTMLWFDANDDVISPGEITREFELFCTEYCGEGHSSMLAKVIVHNDEDFDIWARESANFIGNMPPFLAGEKQFVVSGCNSCHAVTDENKIGPGLNALSTLIKTGGTVEMADGSKVTADDNYLRESILQSSAKIRAGFTNQMPLFQGQLSDDQLRVLMTYVKGLADESYRALPAPSEAAPEGAGETSTNGSGQ